MYSTSLYVYCLEFSGGVVAGRGGVGEGGGVGGGGLIKSMNVL